MGFPRALANAQRGALHGDVLDVLDRVESLHRQLQEVEDAHLVGLSDTAFGKVRRNVATAYELLAATRVETELVVKRRFVVEGTIDESKLDRLLEEDPTVWGIHDLVEAFDQGALGEDAAVVANEEIS